MNLTKGELFAAFLFVRSVEEKQSSEKGNPADIYLTTSEVDLAASPADQSTAVSVLLETFLIGQDDFAQDETTDIAESIGFSTDMG